MNSENPVSKLGSCVCSTCERLLALTAAFARKVCIGAKKAAAPIKKDAASAALGIAGRFAAAISGSVERIGESVGNFRRRSGMFGLKKALSMGFCEFRLAVKRKGNPAGAFINVAFPIMSIAFLAAVISRSMSTSYGVAVEYEGAQLGVVEEEKVLSEAQCTVADRVEYYDTGDSYYVTATLSIKPLSSNEEIIDETILASKMEEQISAQYDQKLSADDIEELSDDSLYESGMVEAYKVVVDGTCLGYVYDTESIDNALSALTSAYDTGEYDLINLSKNVEYSDVEYVDPSAVMPVAVIINQLTGYESAPEYYEVKEGDNLWNIAAAKGMTLDEISGCYATYNGQVIDDLENSILKVGTLIQIESEVPYLQVECGKEVTYRSTIEYETITIEDSSLPAGQTIVETEGKNGEKYIRAMVTYRDDTMVRRKKLDTIIVEQPVSEIIRVGTGDSGIYYNAPEFSSEGGNGEYFWPVNGGTITAHLGDGRGHKGIDIAAPYGTPVYAASPGTVIDVGSGWNGGYGNCVMIQNDDGNVTVYAHLAESAATLDDTVLEGQLIGYVGSTGDSTGNHLHFEVRSPEGKYMDPTTFVSQE